MLCSNLSDSGPGGSSLYCLVFNWVQSSICFIRAHNRESVAEAVGKADATAATLGHVGQQKQNNEVLHEQEPPKKIRAVYAGKGKGLMRKPDVIVKEELTTRTRSKSPSIKDTGSVLKSRSHNVKKRSNTDILTTDCLYYVPKAYDGNDLLEEPRWYFLC